MSALKVTRTETVTRVGFDHPDKRNALDRATIGELHQVLDEAASSPTLLVFHSTTPGMFIAGADIGELRERNAEDALQRINGALFDKVAAHRWPTIAVVDGAALGAGCELALACDFRVASDRAVFGQPELRLGIMAAAGGNWRLERTAGLSVARRMLFAGERLDAPGALGCGLVDVVAGPADLEEAVEQLTGRIQQASWQALEFTKRALALQGPPGSAHFDAAAQAVLFESDEKRARMDRFLERTRPPQEST